MPRRHLALVLVALLGIALAVQNAAIARADTASWADLTFTGSANAYTGTMQQRANAFPAATYFSDSTSGSATGRQSGASTYLTAATAVGQKYGSSQGRPYLNLRPFTQNGAGVPGASTTTYTFERPTPATGWTFVLGDVDADQVTVAATDAAGQPVPPSALGFRSVLNYCGPGVCPAESDVPTWDPATAVLRGNVAAVDTSGAAAWFEPTVPLTSLTFTFTRRAGFPVYQTWFAALAYDLTGTVSAPAGQQGGLTLRLYDPEGNPVASTTTEPDGDYRFPGLATYDGYRVALERPVGLTSDAPLTRTVDLSTADQVVDFSLRAIVPVPVSGTVRDDAGDPVPGVEVTLSGAGPDRTVLTGPDGTYLLDDVPAGTGYLLTATAPPGTSVSGPLTFSVPPESEEPIEDQDFVVTADPVGSASGRVTDAADDPLPGVLITVTGPGGATYAVRTDVVGGWRLDDLPPGDYTATVTPPDGGDVVGADALDFTIPQAGGSADDLDFVIALPPPAPTYPARGTVQDEYDDPVADVEVTVRDPDGTPFATVTTDDEGAWRVPGLPVADDVGGRGHRAGRLPAAGAVPAELRRGLRRGGRTGLRARRRGPADAVAVAVEPDVDRAAADPGRSGPAAVGTR